jgi:hypothetical protein
MAKTFDDYLQEVFMEHDYHGGKEGFDDAYDRWLSELGTSEVMEMAEKALLQQGGTWIVWSNEHNAWWKPSKRGYTNARHEAGRYSFEEACQIVHDANLYCGNTPNEAVVRDI